MLTLPQSTAAAGSTGGGWMGGAGTMMQGLGAGINFGSALGSLFGGGKRTKKAIQETIKAGQLDAAAALEASEAQQAQQIENAHLANFDATIVGAMAKDEAKRTRREGRALIGQQMAGAAGQGAMIDAPVLDIMEEQLVDIEMLALKQIHAGELQQKSLINQRDDFLQSAVAIGKEGRSAYEGILAETKLNAYKLKLQRRDEVVRAFGTMIQSGAQGVALFQGLKGIDNAPKTPPSQNYSRQYESPIGPPVPPAGTAPLIEPQEYMDYAPQFKSPMSPQLEPQKVNY